jgi:hypothetical protein
MPAPSASSRRPATPATRPAATPRRARRAALVGTLALGGIAVLVPSAGATTSYVTRPDLKPTTVRVTVPPTGTAPGVVFTTPKGGGIASGATVFDDTGALVWFRPAAKGTSVLDLKPETYQGRPVAVFWEGQAKRGYGFGAFKIVDQGLREIATVSPGGKKQLDFHEFTITPRNTALAISYKPIRQSTKGAKGGKDNDLVMRNTVEEIDIATNKVLWSWEATKAIPASESHLPLPARPEVAWDLAHLNSVNEDTDGNILVSARHTSTIYKVDKRTKKIIWKLGGKNSSFKMGKGTKFAWQHDAHRRPDGTISLFDNATSVEDQKGFESKGLQLKLDESANTATLVRSFENPAPQVSNTQGNLQLLPNGNWFVGWGGTANNVSEFAPDGRQIFEAKFESSRTESYRAYRTPWSAQPTSAPKAVAKRSSKSTAVRVSWNGATTVASWRAVGGASAGSLVPRATVAKAGFETLLRFAGGDKVVAVEALDAAGNVLSRSKTVTVGTKY